MRQKYLSYVFIFFIILFNLNCAYAQAKNFRMKPYSYYMKILIKLAHKNSKAPFAAMVVDTDTGKVLSLGLNHSLKNPVLHGEIVAIDHAIKKYPHINWHRTALITTAEPCSMCISAIIWAGIPLVIYGTSIPYLEKHHWDQIQLRAKSVIKMAASFYHGKVIGGILHTQTDKLFLSGP